MKREIQREIVKVSTLFKEEISSSNKKAELVREEMNAQFAEIKSLIQQLSKSE